MIQIKTLDTRSQIGRWLSRLRFKTLWKNYDAGVIGYGEYLHRVYEVMNKVRYAVELNDISKEKFDEACQYRRLAADTYPEAFDEIICVILGWW